jgi:hypothetical protein
MSRTGIPRLSSAEAYQTYCRECGALPGQQCTYLATVNLKHPFTTSPRVLALRELIDKPTLRPHNSRYHHPAYRLRQWLGQHAHILTEIQ